MKDFSRNNIFIFSSAFVGLIFYTAGKYLQSLYGLDPPYIYFGMGFFLESAAYIFLVVFLFLLFLTAFRKFRSRKNQSPM